MFEKNQWEIDLNYLKEAYMFAQTNSPDPSTQNGAIIVRNNDIFSLSGLNLIGIGANCFAKGVKVTPERLERPQKYSWISHAERNAVYDAADQGNSTRGTIMYAPWFACADCGIAIVQAGIKEVIGYIGPEKWMLEQDPTENGRKHWEKSIEYALKMFDEAGVKYRWVDGKIGGVMVRFNGEDRRP